MAMPDINGDFRQPPHSFEAEQALIGAIFDRNRAYEDVAEFLRPEHFADPVHGRIFAACAKLLDQNRPANPVTLKPIFEQDGGLAEIGGMEYLARLANSVVSAHGAANFGRIILDMHRRRKLIGLAQDLSSAAYDIDAETEAQSIQEAHEAKLFELATVGAVASDRAVTFGDAAAAAIGTAEAARKARAKGEIVGIATGLPDLDGVLGGLRRSDLIILAGRPSMGKTSLAYGMAYGAAQAGKRVLFSSLEMSAEQLAIRGLSIASGVPAAKIERGETGNMELEQVCLAGQDLRDLPMVVDDTPAISPTTLRTKARRMARRGGLDLIVVDYLQLMRWSERTENRVQEVSKVTAALKAIAKELDVPILALSQLSRALEQREEKRPQLSDLRESGSIEQDADVVMFVYREEYYLSREEPQPGSAKYAEKLAAWNERIAACAGLAEVIIAKQRRGAIGTVQLEFQAELTKFSTLNRGQGAF